MHKFVEKRERLEAELAAELKAEEAERSRLEAEAKASADAAARARLAEQAMMRKALAMSAFVGLVAALLGLWYWNASKISSGSRLL